MPTRVEVVSQWSVGFVGRFACVLQAPVAVDQQAQQRLSGELLLLSGGVVDTETTPTSFS